MRSQLLFVLLAWLQFAFAPDPTEQSSGHSLVEDSKRGCRLGLTLAHNTCSYLSRCVLPFVFNQDSQSKAECDRLSSTMSSIGGIAPKLGQRLSMIPALLPPAVSDSFKEYLLDRNQPYDYARIVEPILTRNGIIHNENFIINSVPIGVGSIGQVHEALLIDPLSGIHSPVIIKIINNNVKHQYKRDFRKLHMLQIPITMLDCVTRKLNLFIPKMKQIATTAMESQPSIMNEFDLRLERKYTKYAQQVFRQANAYFDRHPKQYGGILKVKVANIIDDFSPINAKRRRDFSVNFAEIQVQSKENGISLNRYLSDMANFNGDSQRKMAFQRKVYDTIFAVTGYAFLVHGLVHGDPHFGNILFHPPTQTLIFIDWGQAVILDNVQRLRYCKVYSFLSIWTKVSDGGSSAAPHTEIHIGEILESGRFTSVFDADAIRRWMRQRDSRITEMFSSSELDALSEGMQQLGDALMGRILQTATQLVDEIRVDLTLKNGDSATLQRLQSDLQYMGVLCMGFIMNSFDVTITVDEAAGSVGIREQAEMTKYVEMSFQREPQNLIILGALNFLKIYNVEYIRLFGQKQAISLSKLWSDFAATGRGTTHRVPAHEDPRVTIRDAAPRFLVRNAR